MENEKTSRKMDKKIILFFVITLVVNSALTGINAYLYVSFNTKPQTFTPTFTYISYASAEDANLGTPTQYFLNNEGKVECTVHQGSTKATVWVVTPHYGILSIRIKNFTINKSEYLNSEKQDFTKITFSTEDKDAIYLPLKPTENYLRIDIYLRAYVYPNVNKNLSENQSVKILLGCLYLEAEAFDFETQDRKLKEFSMKIYVEIGGL